MSRKWEVYCQRWPLQLVYDVFADESLLFSATNQTNPKWWNNNNKKHSCHNGCHRHELFLQCMFCTCIHTYWRCQIMTRIRQVTGLIKSILFWIQMGGLTLMLNENTWYDSIISPKIHTNLLMAKMHSEKLEFNSNVGKIDQIHTPLSQLPAITWRHAGDLTLWASMFLRRQTCSN